ACGLNKIEEASQFGDKHIDMRDMDFAMVQQRRKRVTVDDEEYPQRKRRKHSTPVQAEAPWSQTKTRKSKHSPTRKIEVKKFTDGMFHATRFRQDKSIKFTGASLFEATNTAPALTASMQSAPAAFLAQIQTSSMGSNTSDSEPDYESFIEKHYKSSSHT